MNKEEGEMTQKAKVTEKGETKMPKALLVIQNWSFLSIVEARSPFELKI